MATGMLCLFRRKAHTAIKGEVGPSRKFALAVHAAVVRARQATDI